MSYAKLANNPHIWSGCSVSGDVLLVLLLGQQLLRRLLDSAGPRMRHAYIGCRYVPYNTAVMKSRQAKNGCLSAACAISREEPGISRVQRIYCNNLGRGSFTQQNPTQVP